MTKPDGIGLAETIAQVREELARAVGEGRSQKSVQFEDSAVELEFEVTVTDERQVGGGIKVWVASADGRASKSSGQTHRVKVSLRPIDPITGGPMTNVGY